MLKTNNSLILIFMLINLLLANCQSLSKSNSTSGENMTTLATWKPVKTQPLYFETPKGNKFISAASGLVLTQDYFFVIADNDLNLGVLNRTNGKNQLIPILPGELPINKKERKKKKPDFETLLQITDNRLPAPGLIAFPSGSSPQRYLGVYIPFNKEHTLNTSGIIRFDLTRLFKTLLTQTEELNIEGVIIEKDTVFLFHRGNSKNDVNRIYEIAKTDFVDIILANNNEQPLAIKKSYPIELGNLDGVKLTITDATLFDGRKFFLAAAEDTDNPIDDGKVKGTVFGELLSSGAVQIFAKIEQQKLEGLAITQVNQQWLFHTVSDNDDPDTPSQILTFSLDFLSQIDK